MEERAEPDRPEYSLGEAAASMAAEAGMTVTHGPATGPLIHRKIIEVMRAVRPVAKGGEYRQGSTQYNYRRADDVFNALHGAMAEAGIYPRPIVREVSRAWGTTKAGDPRQEVTLKITYEFTAEDGSSEPVHLEIDNWNSSDKGIPVAMTVALRVALLQVFVIPTHDPDPDAVREEMGTAPALSPHLRDYLLAAISKWPVERLQEAWDLLVAHVPGDHPIGHDGSSAVWWEPFAERYRREVVARRSKDGLAELWKLLGDFGLAFGVGGGVQVGHLIKEHNAVLLAEHRAAMQECADAIRATDDRVSLDHAREVVRAHLTNHRISSADSLTFAEMMAAKADQVKAQEAEGAHAAVTGDPSHDGPDESYDGEDPA
jgi:hypothetical protein